MQSALCRTTQISVSVVTNSNGPYRQRNANWSAKDLSTKVWMKQVVNVLVNQMLFGHHHRLAV